MGHEYADTRSSTSPPRCTQLRDRNRSSAAHTLAVNAGGAATAYRRIPTRTRRPPGGFVHARDHDISQFNIVFADQKSPLEHLNAARGTRPIYEASTSGMKMFAGEPSAFHFVNNSTAERNAELGSWAGTRRRW